MSLKVVKTSLFAVWITVFLVPDPWSRMSGKILVPEFDPVPSVLTLKWDSVRKRELADQGTGEVDFVFAYTNGTSVGIHIRNLHTSCGRVRTRFPRLPLFVEPGEGGVLGVTILLLAGDSGTVTNSVTITPDRGPGQVLTMVVRRKPEGDAMPGSDSCLPKP